jgi:hypothetical protein
MSGPAVPLPPNPSLEQLRKQAKDLLRLLQRGDPAARARLDARKPGIGTPVLADVQLVLAREYGFDSWPRLVHHVEQLRPVEQLEQYQALARDLLAAAQGDIEALQRINPGSSYGLETRRERALDRFTSLPGASGRDHFTLADAELLIARQYGFADWTQLRASFAQPPAEPRSAPLGLSTTPPFYRIDWASRTLELRPPLDDADWSVIVAVLEEQGLTGLDSGGQMTDSGLARVSRLRGLTRLNLDGCQRLSDDGLLHLASMPQLEDLDLSGYHSPLTDRGLAVLEHLPALRHFQLCWPQRVTDAGVAHLGRCRQLESVNLLGTHTGDGAIRALAGHERLSTLRTGRQVTDAGLPLLSEIPAFRTWQGGDPSYALMSPDAGPTHLLLDGPFTDQGLAALAGLTGLFGLTFFWHVSAMTPAGLEALAALPRLGFLGCQDALCNDDAMRHIATIPGLRMLMAQGTVATDAGFASLSRSTTLEYLWGRECPNLRSEGFRVLAAMPSLRGLAVSCLQVDDAALSLLPQFPALRELMPMDVTDDGFRHVGRCTGLERLWCMYCRETGDAATAELAGLTELRTYYAGKTRITDRSMEILGRLDSLEVIELWQVAGITDAGVSGLASLPRLRELSVDGSPGVTRAGLAGFPGRVRVRYSG